MKLHWHGEARAEADAAAAFYNDKQPSLAQRFLDDLEDALHRIQRHPQAYRQMEGENTQGPGGAFPLRGDLPGAIRFHRDHRRDALAKVTGILEAKNLTQVRRKNAQIKTM